MRISGIVLIVMGLAMIAYSGFNYVTTEKVVDLGPIQIDRKMNHPVQWSPIAGVVMMVGGIAIILLGKKADKN